MFEFSLLCKSKKSNSRVGEFKTPHGKLLTPELSFVATEGEIKTIPKEILPKLSVNLIIVNTFHLWTKGIIEKSRKSADTNLRAAWDVRSETHSSEQAHPSEPNSVSSEFKNKTNLFNIHDYSNFPRPIMSDSGGFQVFSLGFSKIHGVGKVANIFPAESEKVESFMQRSDLDNPLKITDKGVTFPWNEQNATLTPELSMDLQRMIGADIIFAFDECTSPLNSYKYTKKAMERTHRWLIRCLKAKKKNDRRIVNPQALFAIVQGGYYEDLRKKSTKFMASQDVSGFGIGGSLGKSKEDVWRVLEWTVPLLPDEKPRHLLGIGQVRDLFEGVERGIDTFDCVIPTREARHKILYTKKGKINLRKSKNLEETPDKNCNCQGCKENVTFKKLYQFFLTHDPRSFYYATLHNIQFFSDLTKSIRLSIENNSLDRLKEKFLKYY